MSYVPTIRRFNTEDKAEVVKLFALNVPQFFDPAEETDLVNYLDNEVEDYFVVEINGEIVGAGGINYFPHERTARLSWDFVHPKFHGNGIGKSLVLYRVQYLSQRVDISVVVVSTTQLVWKFYEKMGFELVEVKKDYWAHNFDLYLMKQATRKQKKADKDFLSAFLSFFKKMDL